ncbi:MAG: hypothetical protein AAGE85_01505 [Pseudomonadota bacterium]
MSSQEQEIASLVTLVAVLLVAGCGGTDSDDPSDVSTQPPVADARQGAVGCYAASFAGLDSSQIGCGLINSFGDPAFDLQFSQEIAIQGSFWAGVPATVYAFDECAPDRKNAYAHPDRYILMGYWMARDVVFTTGSALPVAGVLAHEYGHQVQFQNGWMTSNEPTARRTELEADMWSGFYMALAKAWTGPEINTYFQYLFSLGDFYFHDPNHHGTPNQRLAAGYVGFDVGYQVGTSGQPLSYVELHNIFIREVDRITATVSAKHGESSKPRAPLSAAGEETIRQIDRAFVDRLLSGQASLDDKSYGLGGVPESERLTLHPF